MAIGDLGSAHADGRGLLVGDLVRLRPLEERDPARLERWWSDPAWQVLRQQAVLMGVLRHEWDALGASRRSAEPVA